MNPKILIVDDDPNILKLLDISLTKAQYDVISCDSAEKAISTANKEKPDLIISDVNMPEMDGIEFCWMIRENSDVPLTPFIFLTSMRDPDFEVRGYRAGADDFLNKPIDREILLEHVKILLDRNKKLKSLDDKKTPVSKGINGELSELSLVEIIQLLNINKRSGQLKVEKGLILFSKGQIMKAEYQNLKNEDAIYHLVTFKKGHFSFTNQELEIEQELETSTMSVVMEACRRMDESN
jgi:DNA-binding response OmpR family regulator